MLSILTPYLQFAGSLLGHNRPRRGADKSRGSGWVTLPGPESVRGLRVCVCVCARSRSRKYGYLGSVASREATTPHDIRRIGSEMVGGRGRSGFVDKGPHLERFADRSKLNCLGRAGPAYYARNRTLPRTSHARFFYSLHQPLFYYWPIYSRGFLVSDLHRLNIPEAVLSGFMSKAW